MGRLLEIARTVPVLEDAAAVTTVKQIQQLDHIAYRTEVRTGAYDINDINDKSPVPANWNQASADVLGILAGAGQPVLHSQIVKKMAGRGHGKEAAREAIAACQGRGWIWHNLVSGYVLTEDAGRG